MKSFFLYAKVLASSFSLVSHFRLSFGMSLEVPRPRELLAKELAVWLSRTLPTRENFAQAMASTVPPVEEAKAAGAAARVGNAASGSTKSVGDETDGTPTLVVVIDCRSKSEIYADGYIRSSCNMPSSAFEDDDTADELVERLLVSVSNSLRPVFVFHCAFSQQRGPFCAQRFLSRCTVRDDIEDQLPNVYVLKGGSTIGGNLHAKTSL